MLQPRVTRHKCLKEEKFTRIFEILSDINIEIFGKDGIIRTVPRLEGKIDNLTETVEVQTKVVADLVNFQAVTEGVGKYRNKQKLSARQWTSIVISALIGISAIICSFILTA